MRQRLQTTPPSTPISTGTSTPTSTVTTTTSTTTPVTTTVTTTLPTTTTTEEQTTSNTPSAGSESIATATTGISNLETESDRIYSNNNSDDRDTSNENRVSSTTQSTSTNSNTDDVITNTINTSNSEPTDPESLDKESHPSGNNMDPKYNRTNDNLDDNERYYDDYEPVMYYDFEPHADDNININKNINNHIQKNSGNSDGSEWINDENKQNGYHPDSTNINNEVSIKGDMFDYNSFYDVDVKTTNDRNLRTEYESSGNEIGNSVVGKILNATHQTHIFIGYT